LTGKENIYLNGAILGMKRQEIKRKFDEIVDFSDIEKFIDTPVKFYSSGMRVRLGFSVAAHLEPEILLIDEVLTVGDAAFRKKCLIKLNNVVMSEGTTVLFVSHDMTSLLSLCHRAILLENGQKISEGSPDQIVHQYMQSMGSTYEIPLGERQDRGGDGSVRATSLKIVNAEEGKPIQPGCRLKIMIRYTASKIVRYPRFVLIIRDYKKHVNLLRIDSSIINGLPEALPPEGCVKCITDELLLTPGRCIVNLEIEREMIIADKIDYAGHFVIEIGNLYGITMIQSRERANSLIRYKWLIEKD
jgi:lipopolysaccharide transport system ATP-binding protein